MHATAEPRPSRPSPEVAVLKGVQKPATPCPAAPAPIAQVAGSPVDNIQGIRPGMPLDDALALVACLDAKVVFGNDTIKASKFDTFGQPVRLGFSARYMVKRTAVEAETAQSRRNQALFESGAEMTGDLFAGEVRWLVAAFGLTGKERVLHTVRRERFLSDATPTLDAIERVLINKYGKPSQVRKPEPRPEIRFSSQQIIARYTWIFGTDNVQYTSLQFPPKDCIGMPMSPDVGFQYAPNCGVIVQANIRSTSSNSGLAEALDISVVNMAKAYNLVADSQAELAAIDSARAAREVEEAARKVSAPKI